MRFTGRSRKELLWEVQVWYNGSAARPESAHVSLPLFGVSEEEAAYSQELSLAIPFGTVGPQMISSKASR